MTIKRIKIQNLLSFGPTGIDLKLKPLNVLIGPNGCGKSNLLAAISLFQAAPTDIGKPIRESDGIANWMWMRKVKNDAVIEIQSIIWVHCPATHKLTIRNEFNKFCLHEEFISTHEIPRVKISVSNKSKYEVSHHSKEAENGVITREISRNIQNSVLSYFKDEVHFIDFEEICRFYKGFFIYNNWSTGKSEILRKPQETDFQSTNLYPDLSNLFICLNEIKLNPQSKKLLLENLAHVAEGITDFEIRYEFNSAILFLEENEFNYPASRLSDGTLKYLCLLAILLHPNPPSLICIEEPENGLHPDLIIEVARLIKEVSSKTQIIVTTHSSLFVDCMEPEDVVVCEKHDGETKMERLEAERLKPWLEKYSLGNLWESGDLGGNRW